MSVGADIVLLVMDYQGQAYRKGRALSKSRARDADGPAVQLDDLACDSETEAQSTLSIGPFVGLVKAFENIGQELRANAAAGVSDGDHGVGIDSFETDLNAAALWGELDGVGYQ